MNSTASRAEYDARCELQARINKLEMAIREYGNHTIHCQTRDYGFDMEAEPRPVKCTCGFDEYEASQSLLGGG